MNTLAERLQQARLSAGLSQEQLAEKVKVSQQALAKIESGLTKRSRHTVEIARALGVDPIWLASGYGEPKKTGSSAQQNIQKKREEISLEDTSPEQLRAAIQMQHDYVLVPRYDVTASLGHGISVHSEQVVDHLAFQREWVEKDLELKPEDLVLIKSRGDSMMPTIQPGELLLVDTSTQEVHDGMIYVLSFDGDLLAKRIQKTPTGGIVITSDNTKYESFTVPHEEAANLRIVGRVVWAGRRM